jgi:tRNA threonylcarbamoyladenosine biosynthesis protein TsaE
LTEFTSKTAEETFQLGREIGAGLTGGEMILLSGELGAGKTLFTKGILDALGYDVDEVTSPSFTLVNLYRTDEFAVFHIDLWRIDARSDAAAAVGLPEILEDPKAVTIIEWSDRLPASDLRRRVIKVKIEGDGDDPRRIVITQDK